MHDTQGPLALEATGVPRSPDEALRLWSAGFTPELLACLVPVMHALKILSIDRVIQEPDVDLFSVRRVTSWPSPRWRDSLGESKIGRSFACTTNVTMF